MFDLTIVDTLSAGLTYEAGTSQLGGSSAGVASDNAITDPSISSNVLTWDLSSGTDIDIQVGETVTVTYQVLVDNTVVSGQTLTNSVITQWTSLDGVDATERDGSDGEGVEPNDYELATPRVVTTDVQDNTDFEKSLIGETFDGTNSAVNDTDSEVRVGDIVTYQLAVTLNNGLTPDVQVVDTLPSGLAYVDLCLLYTSPSPRDQRGSRMPSSA